MPASYAVVGVGGEESGGVEGVEEEGDAGEVGEAVFEDIYLPRKKISHHQELHPRRPII